MKKIFLLGALLVFACLFVASCSCQSEEHVTVSFESHTDEKISSQTVLLGEKIEEPQLAKRAGYRFLGWYDGAKKWDFEKDTPYKDTTLSAKWESYLSYVEATDGSGLWVVGCSFDVENVVIPRTYNGKTVTGIHWGFADRARIKSVFIPSTVTYIGENSFMGCSGLTNIYCEAGEKPLGWHGDFDVIGVNGEEKQRTSVIFGAKNN